MKLITVVLAAFLSVPALVSAQTTKTLQPKEIPPKPAAGLGSPLVLDMSVRLYGANQRLGAHAGDADTEQLESYVWANESLCSLSSSDTAPTGSPWVAWHFKANVVSKTSQSLVVKVDWQRLFEKGSKPANPVAGSQTVTIRDGERLELDRVAAGSTGACGVAEGRLEVSVGAQHPYLLTYWNNPFVDFDAFSRGEVLGWYSLQGRERLPRQYSRLGYLTGLFGSYNAELWLVHRKPDGSESVQQQTVKFDGTGFAFTFPPIQVSTSRGVITLDFSGKLETAIGDGKAFYFFNSKEDPASSKQEPVAQPNQRIMLSISRRARATGTPVLDITGDSRIAIDVPSPSNVLSFEFPALQKETEDLLKGHQFSLRVRITQAGK